MLRHSLFNHCFLNKAQLPDSHNFKSQTSFFNTICELYKIWVTVNLAASSCSAKALWGWGEKAMVTLSSFSKIFQTIAKLAFLLSGDIVDYAGTLEDYWKIKRLTQDDNHKNQLSICHSSHSFKGHSLIASFYLPILLNPIYKIFQMDPGWFSYKRKRGRDANKFNQAKGSRRVFWVGFIVTCESLKEDQSKQPTRIIKAKAPLLCTKSLSRHNCCD